MYKNEMLSIFMDDELNTQDGDNLIQKMKQDAELKTDWEHFHLIGDSLRNHISHAFKPDFADHFATVLANEPHHFGRPAAIQAPKRFNDTAAGFAMAASISAVALVGLLQINSPVAMSSMAVMPVAYEMDIQNPTQNSPQTVVALNSSVVVDENNGYVSEPLLENSDMPVLAYASFENTQTETVVVASVGNLEESVYDYLVDASRYAVSAPLQGAMPTTTVISYYTDL